MVTRGLAALGVLLLGLAAAALLFGGVDLALWGVHVSAHDPVRLFVESFACLLAALVCAQATPSSASTRSAAAACALMLALYLSLIAAASPQRVGDGHEYVVMARQLSLDMSPAPTERQLRDRAAELRDLPGFGAVELRVPDLVRADGRQEFKHFWIYPLLATPLLWIAAHTGMHWNYAFAAVNVGLLLAFAFLVARRCGVAVAVVMLASPIVWWVDKAQVEPFTFALFGIVCVSLDVAPEVAVVVAGLLTAQNPAFAPVLAVACVDVGRRLLVERRRGLLVPLVGAVALAMTPAAYYLVTLGRVSPLSTGLVPYLPTLTAISTPLVDPFIGVIWFMPCLLLLCASVNRRADTRATFLRSQLLLLAAALVILVICSQMGNVNHGGTPGPSRYGVWLLPVLAPWLGTYRSQAGWRRVWFDTVAVAAMCWSLWVLPPKLPENSSQASRFAVWVSDHVPRAFNSLPEVFGERFGNVDGQVSLPVTSPSCGKVLLAGAGSGHARWPIPCVPRGLPIECSRAGVLCYANRSAIDGYTFSRAPQQPSFGFAADADLTWNGPADFRWLPVRPRWASLSRVMPMSAESYVRDGTGVRRVRAYQRDGEMLAFAELLPAAERGMATPAVLLAPTSAQGSRLWIFASDDHRLLATQPLTTPSWVALPLVELPGSLVVLVVEASRITPVPGP